MSEEQTTKEELIRESNTSSGIAPRHQLNVRANSLRRTWDWLFYERIALHKVLEDALRRVETEQNVVHAIESKVAKVLRPGLDWI